MILVLGWHMRGERPHSVSICYGKIGFLEQWCQYFAEDANLRPSMGVHFMEASLAEDASRGAGSCTQVALLLVFRRQ